MKPYRINLLHGPKSSKSLAFNIKNSGITGGTVYLSQELYRVDVKSREGMPIEARTVHVCIF